MVYAAELGIGEALILTVKRKGEDFFITGHAMENITIRNITNKCYFDAPSSQCCLLVFSPQNLCVGDDNTFPTVSLTIESELVNKLTGNWLVLSYAILFIDTAIITNSFIDGWAIIPDLYECLCCRLVTIKIFNDQIKDNI